MTAYFVSDIHLKEPNESKALRLERFFVLLSEKAQSRAVGAPTHLFLVGDIFDLWIGSHDYFSRRYEKLVDAIRDLVRCGVEVHFFEGNHDLHLREFWEREVGVRVHTDEDYFDLDGIRTRVEHGDLINPDDKGYFFLRWLLRTSIMRSLALNLPSKVVKFIGEKASAASREYTSEEGRKGIDHNDVLVLIRVHAQRAYQDEPFDLIVTGHVHVQDDFSFVAISDKPVRSVNLGGWFGSSPVFKLAVGPDGKPAGQFLDLADEEQWKNI